MDIVSFLWSVFQTALGVVIGTVLSAIVTGLMVNRFVVKRIVNNKDVKDIVKLVKDAKDALIEHNKANGNHEGKNG